MVLRCLPNRFPARIHKHLGFPITDAVNLLRWNDDLLAGKPMAGFDDQETNCPALGIHYKISDVADSSFTGFDVVALQSQCASEVRIAAALVGVTIRAHPTNRREIRLRKSAHAPHSASDPVGRPAIVMIILLFVLP